jgi:hypothetical protein
VAQVVRSWTRGEERKEREQVNKRESCRDASTGASGAGDMEGARRPCLHRMARGSVHVLPPARRVRGTCRVRSSM